METKETKTFDVHHEVGSGIERVTYIPRQRRFETPILMQHGMWHGAWCWQHWQELFAEWGWESMLSVYPVMLVRPKTPALSVYIRLLLAVFEG